MYNIAKPYTADLISPQRWLHSHCGQVLHTHCVYMYVLPFRGKLSKLSVCTVSCTVPKVTYKVLVMTA